MKFKVGDKVIGNDYHRYGITCKGWIGTVIEVGKVSPDPEDDIKVEGKGGEFTVCSKYFDLYEGDNPREDSEESGDEFKVGDRVRHEKGVGTIVFNDGSTEMNFAVEFDEYMEGHTCEGKAKRGHGWWCSAHELTKIEDETPEGEWRVVDRDPRAGDYIRVKKAKYSFSKVGDILRVSEVLDDGMVQVKVCDHPQRKKLHEPSDGSGDWSYSRSIYEVVERVGGDGKRAHTVVIDEAAARPRSEFYNGKVVCISKTSPNTAYTVGKVYEFVEGRVKIDNGNIVPTDAVKSIEEFNEQRMSFGKFAPLIEEEGNNGFTLHLECYGRDFGRLGKPTKFTDRDGNALFIGDIVRISSGGMTVDSVVCTEGKAAFIMGCESSCNEEKNSFGEWSVRKVRSWQDVEDGTLCSRVRFVKSPKN